MPLLRFVRVKLLRYRLLRARRLIALGLVVLGTLATTQCSAPEKPQQHQHSGSEHSEQGIGHARSVPHLRPEVMQVLPHDPSSFTQGLELAEHGSVLYEGTGMRGESLIRAIRPRSGKVLAQAQLPPNLFGEGITIVDDRVWQLTWKAGIAFLRDRASLQVIRRVHYAGEGWGLCFDGKRLVMSDGSARLTFRDPATFARKGEVTVRLGGDPVHNLNELECARGSVWANVWQTDYILRIDPASGRVTAVVDVSNLHARGNNADAGVLNGIAAIPGTHAFLLTGKNWPHLYKVRFVASN